MPILREAVEQQRQFFISILLDANVFSAKDLQSFTLTELVTEYEKLKRKARRKEAQ